MMKKLKNVRPGYSEHPKSVPGPVVIGDAVIPYDQVAEVDEHVFAHIATKKLIKAKWLKEV